jgi:hypothetical protein
VAVHDLWPTIDLVTLGTSCHRHGRKGAQRSAGTGSISSGPLILTLLTTVLTG